MKKMQNTKTKNKQILMEEKQRGRGEQQTGKDQISSRKLEIQKEHFMQRWAQ